MNNNSYIVSDALDRANQDYTGAQLKAICESIDELDEFREACGDQRLSVQDIEDFVRHSVMILTPEEADDYRDDCGGIIADDDDGLVIWN